MKNPNLTKLSWQLAGNEMSQTISDPFSNPEEERLVSTNRAEVKKASDIHELHSKTFGGRHHSFQHATLGGSPRDIFSHKNRKMQDIATSGAIIRKNEAQGMNDTFIKKLKVINQQTQEFSDGDKYLMSPHINGQKQVPWKLQKSRKPESIKSRKSSIKQAPSQ